MKNVKKENICPSCGKTFTCKSNEIEDCFCHTISLSEEVKSSLQARFLDCLCAECLILYKTHRSGQASKRD